MRMVRCADCGKSYDYDDDGFCPKCGAFNQPERPENPVRTPEKVRAAAGSAGAKRGGRALKKQAVRNGGQSGLEIGLDLVLEALDSAGGLAETAAEKIFDLLD